jgi:hypothetical protein
MLKNHLTLQGAFYRYRFILIHLFVFISGYLLLGFLGIVHMIPDNQNYTAWDAGWYNSIRSNGYSFSAGSQSNTGFFPFFPYLWKVLHVNVFWMGVINLLVAFLAFSLLARAFGFTTNEAMLYLSLPGMFFLFVPYSEALFFLFIVILFMGLHQRKTWMIIAGLFFSSLVRPTSFFFIPAIIFMELMDSDITPASLMKALKNTVLYGTVTIFAFFLVIFFQWLMTGVWFAYFLAQINFWKHSFRIPHFPLTTWDGARILWLDGISFWFCLVSFFFCLFIFIQWMRKKGNLPEKYPRSVTFSGIYLFMTMLYVLFFDVYDSNGGTSLLSINRYVFATPFIIILIHHYTHLSKVNGWIYLFLLASILFTWLLCGAYSQLEGLTAYKLPHLKTFFYFGMMTVYIGLYALLRFEKFNKEITIGLYCLNVFLQIYLFNAFLSGLWVG